MNGLDRIRNLDQIYKIGLALLIVLTVGFIASSFQTPPSLGTTDNAQLDYRSPTKDFAVSRNIADTGGSGSVAPESTNRKIVTTIRTTLRVNDVAEAQENTRQLVKQYNGFIESSSIDKRNEVSGRMTVAIPEKNLSQFTNDLEADYRVESQNSDRTDVTDRYNELEAELDSKKQEMEQLKGLMNKSENVSDLVKIQERMSELRSRINFLQKQLEDLEERINYSKVYVTYEGPELLKASFDVQETFFQAYQGVFESIRLMILGAAYLLPFIMFIGLYKVLRKRVRP